MARPSGEGRASRAWSFSKRMERFGNRRVGKLACQRVWFGSAAWLVQAQPCAPFFVQLVCFVVQNFFLIPHDVVHAEGTDQFAAGIDDGKHIDFAAGFFHHGQGFAEGGGLVHDEGCLCHALGER